MSAEKLALEDERAQLKAERRKGYTQGTEAQNEVDWLLSEIRMKVLNKLIGRL